jgi:glycerol-3-phosphate dehydrogenase
LYRRTGAAFVEPEAHRAVRGVAEQLAQIYDWSGQRIEAEIESTRGRLHSDLAFRDELGA